MHVIIGAIGTSGDTLPLIELGRHLVAAGHDVDFIGLAYFESRAKWAGLRFHPAGPPGLFEDMASDPSVWDWAVGFRSLWKVLAAAMSDTFAAVGRLRRDDSVLVGSSGAVGIRLAQEKFGMRAMTVHMSPFYFFSREQNCIGGLGGWPRWLPRAVRSGALHTMDRYFIDGVCRADVNAMRRSIGLADVQHVFTRWIHSPDRVVCAVPGWFAARQADWPLQSISAPFPVTQASEPWTPSAALAAFLADGKAPLVVSACTGAGAASTFFQRAIDAARLLNERVILVSRFPNQIVQPLPSFAFLIDYAPFEQLLPRARAIIHNGGIGTTALAMRAGRRQIIVPFAYDQFFNAMQLAALGGGITVRRQRTAQQLADRIADVLDSTLMAAACVELQRRTLEASDGLRELVRQVEAL